MKIAVIGAGHIGGTIGGKWEAAGHEVVYGLRDPSKKAGGQPIADSLKGAEAVLLAMPAGALSEFVDDHAKELDHKILIDRNSFNNSRTAEPNGKPGHKITNYWLFISQWAGQALAWWAV